MCESLNESALDSVSEAYGLGRRNRSFRRNLDLGLDNVFMPVAVAGRNVPGQLEIRQSRHGDIVSASDTGFQHPTAPDRNGMLQANIVYHAGPIVSAHTPEFDVDNSAGREFYCSGGVANIINAFVQTYRGGEVCLQFGVRVNIVPTQRLLNHEKAEIIEFLQSPDIAQ